MNSVAGGEGMKALALRFLGLSDAYVFFVYPDYSSGCLSLVSSWIPKSINNFGLIDKIYCLER